MNTSFINLKNMTREEAINKIKTWAIPSKNGREVLETLIPELRESEDERIRKKCIELIKRVIPSGNSQSQESKEILDCIAYLEKQKEQKPAELNNRLEEISRNGLENAHTIDFSKEYENSKQILEKGTNCKEWSEEDEEALREVKLNFELNHDNMTPTLVGFYEKFFNKLKSLRPQPHWKPSEEQMYALAKAVTLYGSGLDSLYQDLKKLM